MAEYRAVFTKLWRDEWFSNLDADARVLWLYLITNPTASVAGIYQLPDKFISFDTGINLERLAAIKEQFRKDDRIDYEGDVIWVKRMREYQETKSPKVKIRIDRDVADIPNCRVKAIYCKKYCMDTIAIPYLESDSDKDKDKDKDTETEGEKPPAPPSGSLKAKRADQEVHPALQAWRTNHEGKYPTKDGNLWEVIIATVGDKPGDVKLWSDIQAAWIALSWKPTNAAGMLDYFRRREIPGANRKNGQPPQQPKRVLRSPLAD